MIRTYTRSLKEVQTWLGSRVQKDILALDTETDGLHWKCKLQGISLCDGTNSVYIDLYENSEFDLMLAELFNLLVSSSFNELPIKGLIGHNIMFDLRVLSSYGIDTDCPLYDTMVSCNLLSENDSCGLKQTMERKFGVTTVPFTKVVKNGYSSPEFYDYAINDVEWAWKLYELTKPLLKEQGLWNLFSTIEMPFQYVLLDLYNNGIGIDLDKQSQFVDILEKRKEDIVPKMVECLGMKMLEEKDLFGFTTIMSPLNLNSPIQVAEAVRKKYDISLPKTETGKPSTAYEVLAPLRGTNEFIDLLLRYREVEKLLNTFVNPLKELVCKDGRIRTDFNDCVARTGRLSSSDPNLQNIPKEMNPDEPVNIRQLFVPKSGYKFVNADYEAQELRQLANLSKDDTMIRAFNGNYDLHLFSANSCLGLGLNVKDLSKDCAEFKILKDKYKKERHIGKNGINFPVIYGSTAYGIAKNNQVDKEVAQGWIDGFFKLFPKVKMSIDETTKELIEKHYVTNHFGRKRRFPDIDSKMVIRWKSGKYSKLNGYIRQAFNFKIQGMCADLLRLTMVNLRTMINDNKDWDARLVLTVHDSIHIEVKKEFAEVCAKEVKRIMETSLLLDVPFLAEVNIGDCLE